MKLPIIFCTISLIALSGCADNSVYKPQVSSNTNQQQPVNKPPVVINTDKKQQTNNDLSAIALNYLTKNRTSLGINNPRTDLQLISINKDKYQTQHLKYTQLYKNIPVWASEIIVHIKNNNVYRVDGSAKNIRGNLSVVPRLSSKRAEQSAFNLKSGQYDSQLMILSENNQVAALTYLVKLSSGLNRYMVFVDANNGEVIKTLNAMPNTLR